MSDLDNIDPREGKNFDPNRVLEDEELDLGTTLEEPKYYLADKLLLERELDFLLLFRSGEIVDLISDWSSTGNELYLRNYDNPVLSRTTFFSLVKRNIIFFETVSDPPTGDHLIRSKLTETGRRILEELDGGSDADVILADLNQEPVPKVTMEICPRCQKRAVKPISTLGLEIFFCSKCEHYFFGSLSIYSGPKDLYTIKFTEDDTGPTINLETNQE